MLFSKANDKGKPRPPPALGRTRPDLGRRLERFVGRGAWPKSRTRKPPRRTRNLAGTRGGTQAFGSGEPGSFDGLSCPAPGLQRYRALLQAPHALLTACPILRHGVSPDGALLCPPCCYFCPLVVFWVLWFSLYACDSFMLNGLHNRLPTKRSVAGSPS